MRGNAFYVSGNKIKFITRQAVGIKDQSGEQFYWRTTKNRSDCIPFEF